MTRVIIMVFFATLATLANAVEWDRDLERPPKMTVAMIAEAEWELLPENVEKTKTVLASNHFGFSPVKDEEPNNEVELRGYRGSEPVARLYLEHPLSENVAAYISAGKSRSYAGATVGLAYYLTPEMEIGLSVGGYQYAADNEDTKSFHQTVLAFWFWKTLSIEAEVTVERYRNDPHPWYYYVYAQTPVTGSLSAGIYGEKGIGWGPRLSYSFSKGFSLWLSPIVKQDGESKATLAVGIRKAF